MIEIMELDGDSVTGKSLFCWIQHTPLNGLDKRWQYLEQHQDETNKVLKRDTGLDLDDTRRLSSHITVAKVYPTVQAMLEGK